MNPPPPSSEEFVLRKAVAADVPANVRPELSEIYTKLGFAPTGIESAEVIKTATQPVHFITMSKPL